MLLATATFFSDVLGFTRVEAYKVFPGGVFLRAPGSTNDHDLALFMLREFGRSLLRAAAESRPGDLANGTMARELLATAGALTLEARRTLPGLPASRADVFPAAVVTLLTVAELGGFDAFRHSFFNLRYGIADELLA